jgi:hypothetical protein
MLLFRFRQWLTGVAQYRESSPFSCPRHTEVPPHIESSYQAEEEASVERAYQR